MTHSLVSDVLAWSVTRPGWQRDALRRLAISGRPSDDEIDELAALAVREPADAVPLAAEHLPVTAADRPGVRLIELSRVRHVNALAYDGELVFGDGQLFVVSGWNGAGKSGYARILERVARSRAPEQPVLPNAFLPTDPGEVPQATIRYRLGPSGEPRESRWQEGQESAGSRDDDLARLGFFDSRVAVEHIEKRVDVRYTPLGLDLLAGLAEVCKQVEARLRRRLRALAERRWSWPASTASVAGMVGPASLVGPASPVGPVGPVGPVAEPLGRLGTAEGLEQVRRLADVSDDERAELEALHRELAELRVSDPARRAAEAAAHASQLEVLAGLLRHLADTLGPERLAYLVELVTDVVALELSAAAASADRFADEPLPGVGSTEWRGLWDAARHYAIRRRAYPDHDFPHVDGARCVLCQHPLDEVTAERLERFAAFVESPVEDQRAVHLDELEAIVESLGTLPLDHPGIASGQDLVRAYDGDLAARIERSFEAARALRRKATQPAEHLDELPSLAADLAETAPEELAGALETLAAAERAQAARLRGSDPAAWSVEDRAARLAELRARTALAAILDDILIEHDGRLEEAAVSAALTTCGTSAITRQATELSASGVDELCQAFAVELERLGLHRVVVDLVPGGGTRGVTYVRVTLPSVRHSVQRVLSEGERQIVALAAFLAEITVSGDGSAVILDDPVSSLDHRFRRNVAARLVAESECRQVIVFTHDTVFVNDLATSFHERKLELRMAGAPDPPPVTYRSVVRTDTGAGVVTEGLGLRSPRVASRLQAIERRIDQAAICYEAGDEQGYEQLARDLLRPLREAWERAVEEVLLTEIIVRHGTRVQTRKLRYLVGISEAEVAGVERGMTAESRFLHDLPVGEEGPVPPPAWLRAEVAAVRRWIDVVQNRQRSADRRR